MWRSTSNKFLFCSKIDFYFFAYRSRYQGWHPKTQNPPGFWACEFLPTLGWVATALCFSADASGEEDLQTVQDTEEEKLKCKRCKEKFSTGMELRTHLIHLDKNRQYLYRCDKKLNYKKLDRPHLKRSDTGAVKPSPPPPSPEYRCAQCDRRFSSRSELSKHKEDHNGDKKHFCLFCNSRFQFKDELKDHILSTHPENNVLSSKVPYQCLNCGRRFSKFVNVKGHILSSCNIKSYPCQLCETVCKTILDLNKHKLANHVGKAVEIASVAVAKMAELKKKASSMTQRQLSMKVKKNTSDDNEQTAKASDMLVRCILCEETFTKIELLREHSLMHAEQPDPVDDDDDKKKKEATCHLCTTCDIPFRTRIQLDRHCRMMHESIKRYQCDKCDRKFKNKANYGYHLLVHTGEKPYVCEKCNRAFRRPDHLRGHKCMAALDAMWYESGYDQLPLRDYSQLNNGENKKCSKNGKTADSQLDNGEDNEKCSKNRKAVDSQLNSGENKKCSQNGKTVDNVSVAIYFRIFLHGELVSCRIRTFGL